LNSTFATVPTSYITQSKRITYDSKNNQVVWGFSTDAVNITYSGGVTNTESYGAIDLVIAWFDQDGFQNQSRYGGINNDWLFGLASDDTGLYACGTFQGAAIIGNDTVTSAGDSDMWVAKFGDDRSPRWTKTFGGIDTDYLAEVQSDNMGSLYIAGVFKSPSISVNVTTTVFRNGLFYNALVAKLTSDGELLWVISGSGNQSTNLAAITVDMDGCVFAVGTSSEVIFGNVSAGGLQNDAYLFKIDPYGTVLWGITIGSSLANQPGIDVAVSNGLVFLLGRFSENFTVSGFNVNGAGLDSGWMSVHNATNGTLLSITSLAFDSHDLYPQSLGLILDPFTVVVGGGLNGNGTILGQPVATNGTDGVLFYLQPAASPSVTPSPSVHASNPVLPPTSASASPVSAGSSSNDDDSSVPAAVVAGATAGSAGGCTLIIVVGAVFWCRKRKKNNDDTDSEEEDSTSVEMN